MPMVAAVAAAAAEDVQPVGPTLRSESWRPSSRMSPPSAGAMAGWRGRDPKWT